ncbi:MAG: GtrA family protein [Pseudomonadota bacterium]
MMRWTPDRTLWRFVMVGLLNTAAGLGMIYGARLLGMGEVAANATGYALGLMLSFTLNRRWTFRHRGPLLALASRFAVVTLVAWLVNLAVLLALLRVAVAPVVAQASAVLCYTLVSYLGFRCWAFADTHSTIKDA